MSVVALYYHITAGGTHDYHCTTTYINTLILRANCKVQCRNRGWYTCLPLD